eukprot:gene2884-3310_t
MQQSEKQDLIRRYLKNECTVAQRRQVREWMKSGEAKALFEEVLQTGWADQVPATDPHQLQQWKAKFHERIKDSESPRQRIQVLKYLKYAAILALFILGIAYTWVQHQKADLKMLALMKETSNPNGKLLKITLGDSTTITLNAASKLKYPARFSGKTREVYLEGEAFFEVAHDTAHPFIVHTSKVKVCVLGTSFNISSYREDKSTSVTVATGKVGVLTNNNKAGKTFMLLPGDQLIYHHVNEQIRQSKVDLNEISAWQSGMLICHDQTLLEVSHRIERWYDVKISFRRKEAGLLRLNLKQKNDRLENVMKTLKFAAGIHYEINGKQITIW